MPKCGAVRLLEQMRFERSVPAADNAFEIVLFSYSGVPVPARNNNSTERDQRFESHFLAARSGGALPARQSARELRRKPQHPTMSDRR